MTLRRMLVHLLLAAALTACGQKSALYLPDETPARVPAGDTADEDVSEGG